jgi:hypothetical protein
MARGFTDAVSTSVYGTWRSALVRECPIDLFDEDRQIASDDGPDDIQVYGFIAMDQPIASPRNSPPRHL